MLRARGRPQSQEPMVGVRKRPPTADGDEAGVAIFGEDHGVTIFVHGVRQSFSPPEIAETLRYRMVSSTTFNSSVS